MADEIKNFLNLFQDLEPANNPDGIIDTEPEETARASFLNACISGQNPLYKRHTTKKFVEMLSKIKKEAVKRVDENNNVIAAGAGVYLGANQEYGPYYVTEAGITSLFNTLENSTALEPKRNADGTLNVTPDKDGNVVIMGGKFEVTESVETPVNNTFVIGEETYTYSGVIENNKIKNNTVTDSKGTKILNESTGKVFTLNGISTTQYMLATTISSGVATVTGVTIKKYDNITAAEGKNIILNDATIKDGSIVTLKANNGNVSCNNLVFDASNGGLKNDRIGHACFIINADKSPKSVTVRDCVFNRGASTNAKDNIYNAVEFYLGPNCKSVLIENCQFLGKLKNNAINIYNNPSNCVITVKDCYFDTPSNVLRLSNNYGSDNVTINFINCRIDHWEEDNAVTPTYDSMWAGFVCCQDHKSNDKEGSYIIDGVDIYKKSAFERNIFGPNKIRINITNCVGPNGPIAFGNGESAANYCNTGLGTQLCYVVYDSKTTLWNSSEVGESNTWPKETINGTEYAMGAGTGDKANLYTWNYDYILMKYGEDGAYYPTLNATYDTNNPCTLIGKTFA